MCGWGTRVAAATGEATSSVIDPGLLTDGEPCPRQTPGQDRDVPGRLDHKPVETKGGRVRIVDSTTFPATTAISAALVEVEPGGMRELHWHPNSDELQVHIAGDSGMTVFASGSTAGTFDYQAGDVAYVPKSMPHCIQNTGKTTLKYLEVWKTNKFSDVSLRQWLAFTPHETVRAHLKFDESVLRSIPTRKTPVLPI
jgi:oxalate decarboxylase